MTKWFKILFICLSTIITVILVLQLNYFGLKQENNLIVKEKEDVNIADENNDNKNIVKIGDMVSYSPANDYVWQAKYYASDLREVDIELESKAQRNYSIQNWKIYDIIENNETVLLIPAETINGTVVLKGSQGYNNAVKLLNDACNSLYGNVENGITARSINIEDIENDMTQEALDKVYNYIDSVQYGKQEKKEYEYYASFYPAIYKQEKLSTINNKTEKEGLSCSEQLDFIEKEDDNLELFDRYENQKKIKPYQTFWYGDRNSMENSFKENSKLNYNSLISYNILLASRCVKTINSFCSFGIYAMQNGSINFAELFHSDFSEYTAVGSLFPIVTIPSKLLIQSSEENWKVKI